MSFNTFGKIFGFTTWGESHGPAIGCVIDGCPPGIKIDKKPRIIGSTAAENLIGYKAEYSLRNLLEDLRKYGKSGPSCPI